MPIMLRGARRSEQPLALATPDRGAAKEEISCAANQRAAHAESRVETPMGDREVETAGTGVCKRCAWSVAG